MFMFDMLLYMFVPYTKVDDRICPLNSLIVQSSCDCFIRVFNVYSFCDSGNKLLNQCMVIIIQPMILHLCST